MADVTKNFPSDAGIKAGSAIDAEMPITTLRAAGSATITPFVYICDSGNNRIQVTDYDGNFLFMWGSYGTGNGQFNSPYGVTNDGERVYVTDTGNHRVQYFDLYGNYLGQWGTYGIAPGEFSSPKGIAANDRYIFVIDQGNNRFQIFNAIGTFLMAVGTYGSGENQFDAPTNCYADSFFLWIDDTGNNRIVFYELAQTPDSFIYTEFSGMETSIITAIRSGKIYAELPGMEAEIVSTVSAMCRINAELPGMQSEISALLQINTIISAELPGITADIKTQVFIRAVIEAEFPDIESEIRTLGDVRSSILADLPELKTQIISRILASDVFKTVVINTLTKAVTEYIGFDFNSYAVFNGKYLGAIDEGIFELDGDDDAGTAIDAAFKTGDVDLHAGDDWAKVRIRRIYDIHVHRKATADIILLLQGEQNIAKTRALTIQGSGDNTAHTKRVKPGKGLTWRIVSLEIQNLNGSDFEIEQMVIDAAPIGKEA